MVQVPSFNQGRIGLPGGVVGTPRVRESQTGGVGEGLSQAGELISEIGNRMFKQATTRELARLENDALVGLTNLETEVMEGESYTNAPEAFQERGQQLIGETVQEAHPTIKDELQRNLGKRLAIKTAQLRRDALQKSQANTIRALENSADTLAKDFATAETGQEQQAVLDSLRQKADAAVQSNAMLPAEAKDYLMRGRSKFHSTRASQLIVDGKLNEAEQFVNQSDVIDPDNKRILLNRIEAERQDANRDMFERVDQAVSFMSETGRAPDSIDGVTYSQLKGAAQGTEAEETLNLAERSLAQVNRHKQKPLPQQIEESRERLRQAGTPQELNTAKMLAETTKAAIQAAEERPLTYMEQNGLINPLPELDLTQGKGAAQALQRREDAARRASQHFGMSVVPLKSEELQQIKSIVNSGNPNVVQQTFDMLRSGLSEPSVEQIASSVASDNPTMGVALHNATRQPETARTLIEASGTESQLEIDLTETDTRPVVQDVYGSAFEASAETQAAFVQAAKDVYAQWSLRAGETAEFDDDRFERALKFVAMGKLDRGGSVRSGPFDLNGKKTLPPSAGITPDKVQNRVHALNQQHIDQFGNGIPAFRKADGEFARVAPEDLRDAQYVYVGDGKYTVKMRDDARGGLIAVDENGNALGEFTLDLRRMIGHTPSQQTVVPPQDQRPSDEDIMTGPGGTRGTL